MQDRHADALALLDAELPFLNANRYRRYELYALSIKSRALQSLDRLEEARSNSEHVLAMAEKVQDEAQIALASANLSSVATALGQYPEALRLRQRVEEIRTRQGDIEALPYDQANRADVLIRLARREDADRVLRMLEAGVSSKAPAYMRLARRVTYLRALYFATALECDSALPLLQAIDAGGPATDSTGVLAPAVRAFCDARRRRRTSQAGDPARGVDPTLVRERQYWLAAAALELGDFAAAADQAARGRTLLGRMPNDELRWRLAAISAVAEGGRGEAAAEEQMTASARQALGRLKVAWKNDVETYLHRRDVDQLRKRAGLESGKLDKELP